MTARVMTAILIKHRGEGENTRSFSSSFMRRVRGVDLNDAGRPAGITLYPIITIVSKALHPPGFVRNSTSPSPFSRRPCAPRGAQTGSAGPFSLTSGSSSRKHADLRNQSIAPLGRYAPRDWSETWQTRGESQNTRDSIVYVQITGESPSPELTERHECSGERIFA